MSVITIPIPEKRTAFVFGNQVAQVPVTLTIEAHENLIYIVIGLGTLSQKTEIWCTREEAARIARFLVENLRGRAPVAAQSDQ